MWIFCNPHLMPYSELGGLADLICHGSSGKLGTVYHLQSQSMWAAGTSGKLGPLRHSHKAQHVEGLWGLSWDSEIEFFPSLHEECQGGAGEPAALYYMPHLAIEQPISLTHFCLSMVCCDMGPICALRCVFMWVCVCVSVSVSHTYVPECK